MNVVVGKAYAHDTPVFTDTMQYVVFRPYWNVPYSIAKAEFLSRLARDPDYLAKKGFEVVNSGQDVITSGTVTGDILAQLRVGKLYIRQLPGPKNSLGLVKFIFPNSSNVYMHDTPAQEFFAKSRRDFSHGCIHLENPADLRCVGPTRESGLGHGTRPRGDEWNAKSAGESGPSDLVLILYGTVIVTEDAVNVHFYDDTTDTTLRSKKPLLRVTRIPG